MFKEKVWIELIDNKRLAIERDGLGGRIYLPTKSSLSRLYRAVNKVVNEPYGPQVSLFPGGFELNW